MLLAYYCTFDTNKHNNNNCWLQRVVIAMLSVGGLVLMTSLGVVLTVARRCRRLKHNGDCGEAARSRIQLDDLVKLLCYTGRRRRDRGTAGCGRAKPPSTDSVGQQSVLLPDHGELVQMALRTQSVGAAVMQENERYSSAADVNARGAFT